MRASTCRSCFDIALKGRQQQYIGGPVGQTLRRARNEGVRSVLLSHSSRAMQNAA